MPPDALMLMSKALIFRNAAPIRVEAVIQGLQCILEAHFSVTAAWVFLYDFFIVLIICIIMWFYTCCSLFRLHNPDSQINGSPETGATQAEQLPGHTFEASHLTLGTKHTKPVTPKKYRDKSGEKKNNWSGVK